MKHVGIFLLAFVAVVASGLLVTRPAPLVMEAHSSGAWQIEAGQEAAPEREYYTLCPFEEPRDRNAVHQA